VSLAFRGFIGLQFLIILMIVLNDNNSIQNRYLNRSVFFIQLAPREYCAGSLSGATMGWGKFALARGALLKQTYKFAVVVGVLSIVGARTELARAAENGGSSAPSAQADAVNQALLKKMEAMEQRIRSLEAQVKEQNTPSNTNKPAAADVPGATKQSDKSKPDKSKADKSKADKSQTDTSKAAGDQSTTPADAASNQAPATKPDKAANLDKAVAQSTDKPILGLIESPVPGLSIGAYGEVFFGAVQNPAAGGQWQNSFDARRFVLLPTYAITDNIIFNAEIEFEHAGSGFDNDDKLHGTAEIEQLWIDFKFSDPVSWRAPGIDLVPIGYINQHHEPTQFYSVLRPELYNGLIPSTWKVPATSIYGTIVDGIRYQLMAAASNEDFGDSFDLRTEARTVPPFPIPYFPGVDGINALAFSNPPLGDFSQLTNSVAVTGRVDFTLPQTPGLAWSVSAYFSPNIEPRGAHGDLGNLLGNTSMGVFDAEFRYRIPNTWVELRGEGVWVTFGNPANLRANNDGDPTDNVGKSMYGFSGEVAMHIPMGTIIGTEWEAVPFYRYTNQNFQTAGFVGTDANMPTGQGQTQFHDVGVAVFPSPKVVLKATYQKVINKDPAGANADTFLGGVGFFF
jgi:hypothetical protein